MIDTSKLPKKLIRDIVQNLGCEKNEDIQPYLEQIAMMTPEQAFRCYIAWNLGDGRWADIFISGIDALRKAESK